MPKKNKIIIIIPSYNGQQYWPDLLPTLIKEDYFDFDLEIVVVDNNSSDNSADYIESKYPTITVIRNKENTGYVGANNIGYDYAKSKNADFIYAKNWSSYDQYGKVLLNDDSWIINENKMKLTNNAFFMHCLPIRRNVVVTDSVLDSNRSLVIQQANNRTYATQTILKELISNEK